MANYCQRVLDDLKVRYAHEPEFIQAATEILTTLKPVIERNEEKYEAAGLLERFVEPETPRFFSSFKTESQYFALSLSPIVMVRTSFLPSV